MTGSMRRRTSLVLAVCVLALGGVNANAQGFPDRPVRIIVGFAAGGGTDFLARFIGQKLAEKWGQPVVVENRDGADGTIAEEFVARATPNGNTIGFVINTHTVTPSLRKLNYDPVKSFAPVTLIEQHPLAMVVNPSYVQAKSLGEFIALAKSRPGQLNFGSAGPGTPPFLIMALLMEKTGIKMTHVAYKGTAPMIVAMLGGDIHAIFGSLETSSEQVKAGRLRAIGISTKVRSPLMPDVPTVAETINARDFDEGTWTGILAPANTPKDVVKKLRDDTVAVINLPDVQKRFASQGYQTIGGTPEEFNDFIKKDIAKWALVLKTLDLK